MHIGSRIRIARKAQDVTAKELAKRLGRGAQTVFRWEWGKTSPKFKDLERIARALEVDLSDLLAEGSDDESELHAGAA